MVLLRHHQTAFKHRSPDEARAPTASTAQEVERKDVTRRAEVRLPRGSGTKYIWSERAVSGETRHGMLRNTRWL